MNKWSFITLFVIQAFLQVSRCSEESTAVCSVEPTCIVPQPPAPLRQSSLLKVVKDTQCEMGCIEQHGGVLPATNDNSPWPSLEFDSLQENCPLYQKIYECKMGCKAHYSAPSLTTNRCRDYCFSECEADVECNRKPCDNMPCGRQCRKTFCKFGCLLYDTLTGLNKTHHAHLRLSSPPNVTLITSVSSSQQRLYTVSPSLNTQEQSSGDRPTTAFVIKISSPDKQHESYLWQRNLSAPVDLSAFACSRVTLSYGVVSLHTPLDDLSSLHFSPSTTVCVPGLGGRPSQVPVSSIGVSYFEDTRKDYFGYAVANVSWSRPEGFQFITSYTLKVYSGKVQCGGINARSIYEDIDKELTSFVVAAKVPNGLLKFGCHYTFELITQPSSSSIIGPYINSLVAFQDPVPQIIVDCQKVWNPINGHFNISVSWGLEPSTAPTSHITQFTVTSMFGHTGKFSTTLPPLIVTPQAGEKQFNTIFGIYQPQIGKEYKIEIRSDQDELHHWRRNPTPGSCMVSADPRPSDIPVDISVRGTTYNHSTNELSFKLQWVRPSASYGGMVRYQMRIVTEMGITSGDLEGGLQTNVQNFTADTYMASVESTLAVNPNTHCAYVQMRAVNSFSVASEWSEALVLPLDDQCLTDTSDNTGRISLFYETEDSGNVKLLELGCHSDSALFGGDTQSGLAKTIRGIKERVDTIASTDMQEKVKLIAIEQNLRRVEQKLDALMSLVAIHVHGNT